MTANAQGGRRDMTPSKMASYLREQMCRLLYPHSVMVPIPRDIVLEIADMLEKSDNTPEEQLAVLKAARNIIQELIDYPKSRKMKVNWTEELDSAIAKAEERSQLKMAI